MASQVKNIITNWIEKGNSEKDPFNKYICFWIAFNAIYMSRYHVDGDRPCIKEVKKDSYFANEYKLLLRDKSFHDLINNLIILCPITDEKNGDIYSFSINDFPALIEFLYQIRTTYFMGGRT